VSAFPRAKGGEADGAELADSILTSLQVRLKLRAACLAAGVLV
jgi:hypothetical protein